MLQNAQEPLHPQLSEQKPRLNDRYKTMLENLDLGATNFTISQGLYSHDWAGMAVWQYQ